jgi:adenylate cyclase
VSYRIRLLAALLGTAVLVAGLSILTMYLVARHFLIAELRSKVESIAATVASQVDGDLVSAIRTRDDEKGEGYGAVRGHLRRARDINRRKDVWVNYLFIVRKAEQDASVVLRIVDPEETLENATHVGDVFRSEIGHRMSWELVEVADGPARSERGVWLAATAPIRNRSGASVAALVVEVGADQIDARLRPILLTGAATGLVGILFASLVAMLLSRHMSRPLLSLKKALEAIDKGQFDVQVEADSVKEFSEVAKTVKQLAAGLQERDKVKSAFGRYLSPQIMDSVMGAAKGPELHGERSKVTVMFCDIRGFTTMSENMRPEQVVQILNLVFDRMVTVIFKHGGTLDKFLGDGLMAIFGAPRQDTNQEEHAVRAALEIQQELDKMNRIEALHELPDIHVGIGINSGVAIVGNIGSPQRMEYTAIGDTVNLASRLQSTTSEMNLEILISEYTYNAVRGIFKARSVGEVKVKGRQDAVESYVIEGLN